MVNAIILFKVGNQRINEVAQELVDLEGISEVYSVAGQYDLVAIARTRSDTDLAALMTERIVKVEGVLSTETLIAFRTYSQLDLESMFSVGFD